MAPTVDAPLYLDMLRGETSLQISVYVCKCFYLKALNTQNPGGGRREAGVGICGLIINPKVKKVKMEYISRYIVQAGVHTLIGV